MILVLAFFTERPHGRASALKIYGGRCRANAKERLATAHEMRGDMTSLATAATETPRCWQRVTTLALKSALESSLRKGRRESQIFPAFHSKVMYTVVGWDQQFLIVDGAIAPKIRKNA